jgi:putative transposase
VPEPEALTQSEMLERIELGDGPERAQVLREQLARCGEQPDEIEQSKRLFEPYRRRMYDISIFNKELKGGFAQGYNRRHKRYGALWAERFKSVLLEGGRAVRTISAYIELNPVRAGLCEDPKEYPYCAYAEAMTQGSQIALEGLRTMLGLPQTASREEIDKAYRQLLHLKGAEATQENPPAIDSTKAQDLVEREKGELSPEERLRCKIRCFSDGVILGSRSFVEFHWQRLKQRIRHKCKSGPIALNILGPARLWVLRKLRARAFG